MIAARIQSKAQTAGWPNISLSLMRDETTGYAKKGLFSVLLGRVNLEGARFTKCFNRIREVFVSSVVPFNTNF